jgi:hypothetical protein
MSLLEADRIQKLERYGEDAWGLLHIIQESFGIEFSPDELIAAETVGQLGQCISRKLTHPRSERCLNAAVFYRLRRAFVDSFTASRATIRPDTPLNELLPWTNRRTRWREINVDSGLILPDLTWPLWLLGACLLVSGLIVALIYPSWIRHLSDAGLVSGVAGILIWVVLLKLLSPLALAFPKSCATFGDLVRFALARNYATVAKEIGGSSQADVLLALRYLIAVAIGKSVDEVRPQTRFPAGLNIE